MASNIKLKNHIASELNITHSDNEGAIEITSTQLKNIRQVDTIAGLRAMTDTQNTIWVSGYHTKDDGAFGSNIFRWNPTSTEDDNGGTIIKLDSVATGRYELQYDGAVNVKWFGAVGDNIADDNSVSNPLIQNAIDFAISIEATLLYFPKGNYKYSKTLEILTSSISLIGEINSFRQSGTIKTDVTFIWSGGAEPMIECNKNLITFGGFSVRNEGSATCWLQLESGAQNFIFKNLSFIKANGHIEFSDAVIRSNGARLGYSQFKGITALQPAENFINVYDAGTSGLTPVSFTNRCIFRSAGDFTILKIDNSGFEGVHFTDSTFIKAGATGKIVLVDSLLNPVNTTIFNLNIENCEFDADTAISNEFLNLVNVLNVSINNNNIYGNGSSVPFASFINSNLTSLKGNYAKGISYIVSADTTSKIRGVGSNNVDSSTVLGFVDGGVWKNSLTQATAIAIDAIDWGQGEIGHFVCDITDNSAYTFFLDVSKPQNIEAGQVFVLTIRNVSGGAIANPIFSIGTMRAATITAPSNNNETSIMFRYDGTRARQITPQTPDVYTL